MMRMVVWRPDDQCGVRAWCGRRRLSAEQDAALRAVGDKGIHMI